MYSKVNYTIVGLFVVLFTIGMVWFGFWLGKYGQKDTYDTYQTYFSESISGLSKDSTVMLHGISIGYVSDISIDKKHINQTHVILKIKKDIPITEDMYTTLKMMGITGLLSVEIEGGSSNAKLLKPTKSYIPTIPSKKSWINDTKKMIENVSADVQDISQQLKKVLSDKNIEHFNNILANSDDISNKLKMTLDEVNSTIQTFKESITHMDSNFSSAIVDFHSMSNNFDTITKKSVPVIKSIKKATLDFQVATDKFTKSLDRGDYNIKRTLEPTIMDIQMLSQDVSDLLNTIMQSPNAIIFRSREVKKGPGE